MLLEQVGLDNIYEGYLGDLVVQNHSGKAIIAAVATVVVHYSNGLAATQEDIEEDFWAPTSDLDSQGYTSKLGDVRLQALTEKPVSGRTAESFGVLPQAPSVEVIARWAQFADGTTWGDNQNPQVQETLIRRRSDVDTFRRLANVYDTQGPEAFAHEVDQLPRGTYAGYPRLAPKARGKSPAGDRETTRALAGCGLTNGTPVRDWRPKRPPVFWPGLEG